MTRIVSATILALMAAVGAFAADLSREAKVERILDVTNARAMQDQMLAQMKQMALQQVNANLPADQKAKAAAAQNRVFDLISNRLSWDKMRGTLVKAYAETFSDQELDGILGFYESPAGRAMIQKMPALMMKTMQQVQATMRDIGPEIEKIVREESTSK